MIKTKHVLRITNKIKKELGDMFLTGSLINSQYILDCLYKNEFETYFQIGMTSTYYIYIPTI